ncbi:MAG: cytochrome c-type biosis protein CcmI [Pseudomonadota bacterium]
MTPTATFWLLALLLAGATLAGLLPPLWRGGERTPWHSTDTADAGSTLALLRGQLQALEREQTEGRLDARSATELRAEISRRLLEEHGNGAATWHDGPTRGLAWALGLAVTVLAVILYGTLGTPQALSQPERAASTGQPSATQVEAMVSQMTQALEARAQRGESRPEDGPAWAMAARTLATMQRFQEADRAFARALAIMPNDAHLLADRADILSLLQGQNPEGEPMRLIERALRLDPNQPKALALAGSVAFRRGELATAISHWQRALDHLPPESEFARGLAQSLQQARQAQGMAPAGTSPRVPSAPSTVTAAMGASIRGRVSLTPAMRSRARPDDTVFIVARAEQGPRMPLAIVRLRVADLPAEFTLDDSSAMTPQMRLSAHADVVVSARISRSGQALPESGDLVATPVNTRVGIRGVELRIDRVQP